MAIQDGNKKILFTAGTTLSISQIMDQISNEVVDVTIVEDDTIAPGGTTNTYLQFSSPVSVAGGSDIFDVPSNSTATGPIESLSTTNAISTDVLHIKNVNVEETITINTNVYTSSHLISKITLTQKISNNPLYLRELQVWANNVNVAASANNATPTQSSVSGERDASYIIDAPWVKVTK